jgi:hypothetical protein
MDAHASKQYRAALDALFAKGEVGKLAEKMGPGSPRIDPHDLVRGTHREGGDSAAKSGAGSSGSSTATGTSPPQSSSGPERVTTKAPPAPAHVPPKEDGRAALRKKVVEALGRDEISPSIATSRRTAGPATSRSSSRRSSTTSRIGRPKR